MVDVFHFTCHFYYKSPPQKFKLDLYGYEVPEEASKLLTKRVARSRLSLGRRSCRYFSSLACPCVCRKWLSFKCLSYRRNADRPSDEEVSPVGLSVVFSAFWNGMPYACVSCYGSDRHGLHHRICFSDAGTNSLTILVEVPVKPLHAFPQ